jgi:hypothetical protein
MSGKYFCQDKNEFTRLAEPGESKKSVEL